MTVEQYEERLVAQEELCALCRNPQQGSRPLYVDHDHETGAFRGLLCHTCNSNLGGYEAMKKIEDRVVVYLAVV